MIKSKIKAAAPHLFGLLVWLLTDNALTSLQRRYDEACGRLEARGMLGTCGSDGEYGLLAITCVVAAVAMGYALRQFFIWSERDRQQEENIRNYKPMDRD